MVDRVASVGSLAGRRSLVGYSGRLFGRGSWTQLALKHTGGHLHSPLLDFFSYHACYSIVRWIWLTAGTEVQGTWDRG